MFPSFGQQPAAYTSKAPTYPATNAPFAQGLAFGSIIPSERAYQSNAQAQSFIPFGGHPFTQYPSV